MAKQGINTGTSPNDGTGDTLLQGAVKTNDNFDEIYDLIGTGTTLFVGIVSSIKQGNNIAISTTFGQVEISVSSSPDFSELNVTGISTLGVVTGATYYGDGSNLSGIAIADKDASFQNLNVSGVSTLSSVNIEAGNASLENINISGISTLSLLKVDSGIVTSTSVSVALTYFGDGSNLTGITDNIVANSLVVVGVSSLLEIQDTTIRNGFYFGDGSGIINVVGAGITVENNGVGVGTAKIINFGSNLTATTVSDGITTVTANAGSGSTANINADSLSVTGISTLGIVTGATYFGDGSNLTGIIASGVGITVRDAGVSRGTASILNFDSNLTVTNVSGGIATITASAGSGSTANISADSLVVTGISTLGVVTGATYYGNGSNLTGITTLISAGDNITVTTNAGITTIASTAGSGSTSNINSDSLVVTGISTLGVVTGATYYGNGSNLADARWTLGADGSANYTFTGVGFTVTTNDPIIYLARGNIYEFLNNSGGGHPFQIRVSNGGSAYNNGVTNNGAASGTIRFEVPFNAPDTLYYQCTNHAGMGNTISIYPNALT